MRSTLAGPALPGGRWPHALGGGLGVLALLVLLLAPPVTVGAVASEPTRAQLDLPETARAAAQWSSPDQPDERAEVPTDRYELAGGCYTVHSVAAQAPLVRAGEGYALGDAEEAAEPFLLRATALGRYLLVDTHDEVVAADEGLLATLLAEVTDNSAAAILDGLARGEVQTLLDDLAAGDLGTATGRGDAVVAAPPGELGDLEVVADGDAFRLRLPGLGLALGADGAGAPTLVDAEQPGAAGLWTFHLADACADWDDIDPGVDGPVVGGETPYGQVRGYLDAHLHLMANEFLGGRARCGQPWHPYGVEHALAGCDEDELLGGRTRVLETVLSGGVDPVEGHDTEGWPTFADWPRHDLLTYEQVHYRWLERAWRGGLRMTTALLVDNAVLCEVFPFTENSCNEMDGVRLQAQRMHELSDYIDAQHGGPGQGWLQIVEDPFEARRVMNEGRLAVVLGMEVSRPFDCRLLLGVPQCSRQDLDRELAELYDLGVRQLELVNKFGNALTGVAGDPGTTGVVVNAGNVLETGNFWQLEPCEDHDHDHGHGDHHGDAHDRTQMNLPDEAGTPEEVTGRDSLVGVILEATGSSGAAPLYPEGPHCNRQGLTDLGEHVLDGITDKGMIFDPDHMSAAARHEAMDVIEEAGHSGVVSSHSWADDITYQRIYEAGGVVTPMAGSSTGFAETWEQHRDWADERYTFGFGFGSDVNGFAAQGAPRLPGADADELPDDAVTYPFEGFGGATVQQQVSGERVFDVNTDGVAHYGLYPDWVEDLRQLAGEEIVADLELGPEAYLQTWERAVGIDGDACRADVETLTRDDVEALDHGTPPEEVLLALGQPRERAGPAFTYCLDEGDVELGFDDDEGLASIEVVSDVDRERGGAVAGSATGLSSAGGSPGSGTSPTPDGADASVEGVDDAGPGAAPAARAGDAAAEGAGLDGGGHVHGHAHGHIHGALPAAVGDQESWGPPLASAAMLVLGLIGVAIELLRRRGGGAIQA